MRRWFVLVALVWAAPCVATDLPPRPEVIESEDFRAVLTHVGDTLYIAGQPTEDGIRWARDQGVTTVVNLRTRREMDDRQQVPFDEATLVSGLGMTYVHIPAGGDDAPYAPAMVAEFADAISHAEGKVLLHCTVAWRASHLYAAYLVRFRGVPVHPAIEHAKAVNWGTLPFEGFIGKDLRIVIAD